MQRSIKVGLGVALWSLALHCAGGQKPSVGDAQQALRFACEAMAVAVTTGTSVPVDTVVRQVCHVERTLAEMQRVVRESELPDLVESWPGATPAPRADAGAQ